MRLTIVTETSTVNKDGLAFENLDLTACGIPANIWALQWKQAAGHIEFDTPIPNQDITSLPVWANNCLAVWEIAYQKSIEPPPPPTAEQNKRKASVLLQTTDWTTIPDVANPAKSNPYLVNIQDFVDYRNAVRQYAVYPIAGDINWPTAPQSVWAKV